MIEDKKIKFSNLKTFSSQLAIIKIKESMKVSQFNNLMIFTFYL